MARLIVRDGRLGVAGGRLVSDAGGAPCCCGGGSGVQCCTIYPSDAFECVNWDCTNVGMELDVSWSLSVLDELRGVNGFREGSRVETSGAVRLLRPPGRVMCELYCTPLAQSMYRRWVLGAYGNPDELVASSDDACESYSLAVGTVFLGGPSGFAERSLRPGDVGGPGRDGYALPPARVEPVPVRCVGAAQWNDVSFLAHAAQWSIALTPTSAVFSAEHTAPFVVVGGWTYGPLAVRVSGSMSITPRRLGECEDQCGSGGRAGRNALEILQ